MTTNKTVYFVRWIDARQGTQSGPYGPFFTLEAAKRMASTFNLTRVAESVSIETEDCDEIWRGRLSPVSPNPQRLQWEQLR